MDYPFVQARHYTPGRIKSVQLIVIHSAETPETANTAENVARYFATTDTKASAHFTVDQNSVVQSVRVEDTAWHCKNANANGIGVEHAGRAQQTAEQWLDDYGRAMLELSAELAAGLCKRFGIEPVRAEFLSGTSPTVVKPGFTGHVDVPGSGTHWDPGPGFPWEYFIGRVAYYLDPPL